MLEPIVRNLVDWGICNQAARSRPVAYQGTDQRRQRCSCRLYTQLMPASECRCGSCGHSVAACAHQQYTIWGAAPQELLYIALVSCVRGRRSAACGDVDAHNQRVIYMHSYSRIMRGQ